MEQQVTSTADEHALPKKFSDAGSNVVIEPLARAGAYLLRTETWLAAAPETVFDFFSDAFQLEAITPPWLHFQVLTPAPIPLHAGAMIDYRLRLRLIPLRWRSEIAVWDPPFRFVDRQVRGPYRFWVHEHVFEPCDGGTLIRDRVEYAVPGGRLVNALCVSSDLRRIFTFRSHKVRELLTVAELHCRRSAGEKRAARRRRRR